MRRVKGQYKAVRVLHKNSNQICRYETKNNYVQPGVMKRLPAQWLRCHRLCTQPKTWGTISFDNRKAHYTQFLFTDYACHRRHRANFNRIRLRETRIFTYSAIHITNAKISVPQRIRSSSARTKHTSESSVTKLRSIRYRQTDQIKA